MRKTLNISVAIKPFAEMKYDTVGDYYLYPDSSGIRFEVADTGRHESNLLILIHEEIEHALIDKAGISIEEIEAWDKVHPDSDEPGEIPGCPYFEQHALAEAVCHIVCNMFGITWQDYAERVRAVWQNNNKEK